MDESQLRPQREKNEIDADYANNTAFEPTIWDLKLVFGEYSERSKSIEYHTSITVPWAQAKLMMYYLQVNITAHELAFGKVPIPQPVIPPEFTPPTPEQAKDLKSQEIFEAIQKLRNQFLESLK